MKKRIAAAALALAAVFGIGLGTVSTASASPTRTQAMAHKTPLPVVLGPQQGCLPPAAVTWAIRPALLHIDLSPGSTGCGGGDFMSSLRWTHWNASSAYGRGHLQSCRVCHASIMLWRPVWTSRYGGWRYFSRLTVRACCHSKLRYAWSWKADEWVRRH